MSLIINTISLLGEESGVGNYTRHIARACMSEIRDLTFFYGYRSNKLIEPTIGKYGSWLSRVKELAKRNNLSRKICFKILRGANAVVNSLFPREWDCYFEPNFVFLPSIQAKRKVLTIHDFSCFSYPEWHPESRVRYMEKYFWESVEIADHIITVSNAIRQESIEKFKIPPERITAIPLGVDHALFYPRSAESQQTLRQRYRLPPKFVLYVGTVEPRKNLVNLFKAYEILPTELKTHYPLVLIGSKGWKNEEIMKQIRANSSSILQLGFVPRKDLPIFYSAASLFIFPSWYEGFGLPVLEAMACGSAVITSNDAALMEVASDAAVHVPPDDIEEISQKMRAVLGDNELRSSLSHLAPRQAAKYSWTKSAQKHLQLFHSLV